MSKILWILSVNNGIRLRDGVVCEAVVVKVDFGDTLLHACNECGQGTETIGVSFAAVHTCQRNYSVVQDESDVRWCTGSGAGKYLADQVGSERRELVYVVRLLYRKYISYGHQCCKNSLGVRECDL